MYLNYFDWLNLVLCRVGSFRHNGGLNYRNKNRGKQQTETCEMESHDAINMYMYFFIYTIC